MMLALCWDIDGTLLTTGRAGIFAWEDAVREALCFGWIDSKVKPIDDERYKQIFTPRKPRSVWSKINKQHVLSSSKPS